MSITCLLIGQDNLLIQCGKYLLEKGHIIKWVVSSTPAIQSWCEKQQISCISSMKELPEDRANSVDYLFSIVNGIILKKEDIQVARHGAINYHDSLLPKYAGINATTWSIINGETSHGITWHMINEGIDTGDIVYQSQFPIENNDTVLSLNLRCFEEAINGFMTIIQQIETSSLTPQPQGGQQRSYYGLNHPVPNLGFIDWNTADAEFIFRLYRALSFGNYSNNVGTLKLYLTDSFLIISDLEVVPDRMITQKSGTVLAIDKQGILIATNTHPIRIKKLMDLRGNDLSIEACVDLYKFQINQQLPIIDSILIDKITPLYKSALTHEKYWQKQLSNCMEHTLFTDRLINNSESYQPLTTIELGNHHSAGITLLTAVLVYLYRINNYEPFTVYWENNHPVFSANLFATSLPFSTECIQPGLSLARVQEQVQTKLNELLNKGSYLTDVCARQPALTAIVEDVKDYVITIGFNDHEKSPPKDSLIHFSISPNKGSLYISHRINCQYLGGTIMPVLTHMSTHIKHIVDVLITSPETLVNQFSFLDEEEKAALLSWSSGEYVPLPSNTITDLFERQVNFAPEHLAVYEDNTSFTYQQLWQNAEKITAFVQSLGLPPRSSIAVLVQPGANFLAVILAVIKAGCVCIPLNPNTKQIDSAATAVLADQQFKNQIATQANVPVYDIEAILMNNIAKTQPNLSQPRQECLHIHAEDRTFNQKQLINFSFWLANKFKFTRESIFKTDSLEPFPQLISCVLFPLIAGGAVDFR
jgi:methionyl-tRNA formyltransferase